jgi:hypothetical protein
MQPAAAIPSRTSSISGQLVHRSRAVSNGSRQAISRSAGDPREPAVPTEVFARHEQKGSDGLDATPQFVVHQVEARILALADARSRRRVGCGWNSKPRVS